MATASKTRQQLTRGDRAPNVFLPDQRDIIISSYDKARGDPIFVLLFSGLDTPADSRGFVLWDYDHDGWQDIAVVNANEPLLNLYHNEIASLETGLGGFAAASSSSGKADTSKASPYCLSPAPGSPFHAGSRVPPQGRSTRLSGRMRTRAAATSPIARESPARRASARVRPFEPGEPGESGDVTASPASRARGRARRPLDSSRDHLA